MRHLDPKLLAAGLLALTPTFGCQAVSDTWDGMSTEAKTAAVGIASFAVGTGAAKTLDAGAGAALLAGAGVAAVAAAATYCYYDSRDASEAEQLHAARKADAAKLKLQEERIRELERKNAVLAVRVDDMERPEGHTAATSATDKMEVIYVDPSSGEPVDHDVHTVETMAVGSEAKINDRTVVFLG